MAEVYDALTGIKNAFDTITKKKMKKKNLKM